MLQPHPRSFRRSGFSYLETQVAMVLFMMTVSGVVPLAVVQTRQLARVESRFEPGTTQYLNQPEGRWARKLGAPALLSDTPPESSDSPDESWTSITIDDQDEGYTERNSSWHDWYHYQWSSTYGGDFTLNFPDDVDDRAVWEFKNLRPAKYDVLVTYPAFAFANRDAEYEFFLNGEDEGHKKIDQRQLPEDLFADGVRWEKLDSIKVKTRNSTLRVELSDQDAKGYNVIDAVRLVPELPRMFLHKLTAPLHEDYLEVRVHIDFPKEDTDKEKGKYIDEDK